jgi:acid phosphatase family membrane protein YuiD
MTTKRRDNFLVTVIHNFPLIAALSSILLAQVVKVPIYLTTNRSWNPKLALSTGGMPSSHSAAVCSLTTAIGIVEGISSSAFAISVVLSAITMFDAAGIRRHAGIHATFINRLLAAEPSIVMADDNPKTLKELLGHQPIEVIAGAFFGIIVSVLLYWSFYHPL